MNDLSKMEPRREPAYFGRTQYLQFTNQVTGKGDTKKERQVRKF